VASLLDFGFFSTYLAYRLMNILTQLPMSREHETEADHVGLLLMAASCYDPREATKFWERMSMIKGRMGEEIPEFASTHPSDQSRVQALTKL